MEQRNIVHVHLECPYKGKTDFYFGSVAAIYEELPKEVVGAGKEWLWAALKGNNNEYKTRKAIIKRSKVVNKHQNKRP